MKYFLLVFLLITSNIYSQENSDKVYNSSEVDEKPEFVGGMKDFYKFTANNFNIPSEGLNGKIIVEFVIEKDGSVTNINVIQDIGFGTAEETIRFLNNVQNGNLVKRMVK